jgi:hypothetical protein
MFCNLYTYIEIWVKICQKSGALYIKVLAHFVVTGDTDSPQKHVFATPVVYILPAVTYSSTMHTERNVLLALQQWLRERSALLHHTYATLFCCF